jgi:hypothetical protein
VPCGSVWSVAHGSGDSRGKDAHATVAEALAFRLSVAPSPARGVRLAWRGGVGGLHGGGGSVRCGLVKEHPPYEVIWMVRGVTSLHGGG